MVGGCRARTEATRWTPNNDSYRKSDTGEGCRRGAVCDFDRFATANSTGRRNGSLSVHREALVTCLAGMKLRSVELDRPAHEEVHAVPQWEFTRAVRASVRAGVMWMATVFSAPSPASVRVRWHRCHEIGASRYANRYTRITMGDIRVYVL